MIKANTMSIFNSGMILLLKSCLFLWFFDVFCSTNSYSHKRNMSMYTVYTDQILVYEYIFKKKRRQIHEKPI